MKSSLSTLVATSTLAFLAACGGSDGGTSSQPDGKVAITSANQNDVARASIDGGLAVSLAQGSLGGGAAPASVAGRSHALGVLLQRAVDTAVGRRSVASVGAHPAAVSTSTSDCSNGGTFTSAFDDKDGNNQVSGGDVITATFAQCGESSTVTVNGSVVVTVTGTPTDTQFSASAQFQNLTIVDDGATSTVSGTVAVTETDMTTLSDSTITVGAGGLTVGVASSGYNDTIAFQQGLVITTAVVGTGSNVSVTVAGSLSSTALGGTVGIVTPVALSQGDTDPYPVSGEMIITGGSGSKLLVTVLNNAQVKLELDANGDGSIDSTSTVAWSTLLP